MTVVDIQFTPNPATMKFVLDDSVALGKGVDFANAQMAQGVSPLAERLFSCAGVQRVYLGSRFVSVTKADGASWDVLQPTVVMAIDAFVATGLPVMASSSDGSDYSGDPVFHEQDAQIVAQIRELLDERVRPVIEQDGGDIVLRGFDRGIVYMELRGACVGCPSASATLKIGIENLLRHYVPEVVEVRSVG